MSKKPFYTSAENYLQNGLYALIFAIVACLCWPLAPQANPNPTGILLPQGNAFASISSDQVQVGNTKPINAQLVGYIHTQLHYATTSSQSDSTNLAKSINTAKKLAAQYGANIIVINMIGRTIESGPLDGFVIAADAYHD
jgi:hypothetical protein